MLTTTCPQCYAVYTVQAKFSGKAFSCRKCGCKIRIAETEPVEHALTEDDPYFDSYSEDGGDTSAEGLLGHSSKQSRPVTTLPTAAQNKIRKSHWSVKMLTAAGIAFVISFVVVGSLVSMLLSSPKAVNPEGSISDDMAATTDEGATANGTETTAERHLVDVRSSLTTEIAFESNVSDPPRPHPGTECQSYVSEGHLLSGLLTLPKSAGPYPAIVHCHFEGGRPLFSEEQKSIERLVAAGFAVFIPTWRGESGNTGTMSLCFSEVTDAINATEYIASRPDIDPDQIFLTGNGNGGTIAILAAQLSKRPRGVAVCGPVLEWSGTQLKDHFPQLRQGQSVNSLEISARSPLHFAADLNCPVRIISGKYDDTRMYQIKERHHELTAQYESFSKRAKAAGKDVTHIVSPITEDHYHLEKGVADFIDFFRELQQKPRQSIADPPRELLPTRLLSEIFESSGFVPLDTKVQWTSVNPDVTSPDRWDLIADSETTADWSQFDQFAHAFTPGTTFQNRRWSVALHPPGQARIIDVPAGRTHAIKGFPRLTAGAEAGEAYGAGVSSDGKYFAIRSRTWDKADRSAGERSWITIHASNDGSLLQILNDSRAGRFSGQHFVTTDCDRGGDSVLQQTLRIIGIENGQSSDDIPVRAGSVWNVSPGGKYLFIAEPTEDIGDKLAAITYQTRFDWTGVSTQVTVFDIESGKKLGQRRYPGIAPGRAIMFSNDGVGFAMLRDSRLSVFDAPTGDCVATASLITLPQSSMDTGEFRLADSICPDVDWLDGHNYLIIRNQWLLSQKDGRVVSMVRPADLPRTSSTLVQRFGNWVLHDSTKPAPLPLESYTSSLHSFHAGKDNNILNSASFRLEIQAPEMSLFDRKCLETICKAGLVRYFGKPLQWDEAAPIILRLKYQEAPWEQQSILSSDNREVQWRVNGKTVTSEQFIGAACLTPALSLETKVRIELVHASDGKSIFDAESSGQFVSKYLDVALPIASQARAASLGDAFRKLRAPPYFVPKDPNLTLLPDLVRIDQPRDEATASPPPSATSMVARNDWLSRDFPIPASIDIASFQLEDFHDRNTNRQGPDSVRFIEFAPKTDNSALIGVTEMGIVFRTDLTGKVDKLAELSTSPDAIEVFSAGTKENSWMAATSKGTLYGSDQFVGGLTNAECHVAFTSDLKSFAWYEGSQTPVLKSLRPRSLQQLNGEAKPIAEQLNFKFWKVAFSSDEKSLLAHDERDVAIFEFPSLKQVATFPLPANVRMLQSVEPSPDGQHIAVVTEEMILLITTTGKVVAEHPVNKGKMARFSPDGRLLLVGRRSPHLDVLRAPDLHRITTLAPAYSADFINALCWSPDGQMFAAVGYNRALSVWRTSDVQRFANE